MMLFDYDRPVPFVHAYIHHVRPFHLPQVNHFASEELSDL